MVLTNLKSHSNLFICIWYMYVSLLVDHISTQGHLSPRSIYVYFGGYEILRSVSVDLHFKAHIQNLLESIVKTFLIVGSSTPPHLGFGILRLRTNIWLFFKYFDFDLWLPIRVYYPKRSYNLLSNFFLTN